jgi:tight adherence protein B
MSEVGAALTVIFLATSALAWLLLVNTSGAIARHRDSFAARAQTKLDNLFVFVDARRLWMFNLLGILLVPLAVYLTTGTILLAALLGVGAMFAPQLVYRHLARRRLEAIELALPDVLAQIAGAMRAGATLSIAIENMLRETRGPISQEFGMVLKEQRVGVPIEQALVNLSQRVRCENVDLVVAAALIAKDVGGNLAEIFERLSTTLRQKIAMEGKINALTAQGKLQGWVVGLLPLGLLLVLSQLESRAVDALLSSLAGWIWLALILILELLGLFMIRKIVSIDV